MSKETDKKLIKALIEYKKKLTELDQTEMWIEMFICLIFLVFLLCLVILDGSV